jgi:DNA-binding SARP family transcriptional activator
VVVRVAVTGRVEIAADGKSAGEAALGRLGRLALAYLVSQRHRPVARDDLAEVLWGDDLPSSWEQLLRGLASKIRAAAAEVGLDETVLTSAMGAYQLHLPPGAVVDVEEAADSLEAATAALAAGDAGAAQTHASEAVSVAARQFLPGGTGIWVERLQAEVRELHVRALEVLARALLADARWGEAVATAEQAVAIEPFRESAYLVLIAAHAGAGSRGEALRAYERCRRLLADELGVSPSASTEAAYLALLGEEPVSPSEPVPMPLPAVLVRPPGDFLVGRDSEVGRLLAAFERSTDEGRQAVFVAGEPGIGKTTLVAHFARAAHADGARVLYGRCDEEFGLSYQPFVEALSQYVASASLAELTTQMGRYGGELARLVPALTRRLPDVAVPTTTDPDADRHRLFDAVGSFFVAAAEVTPVVLVLDDLHWAGSPTLLLLRQLLRATVKVPVVVVGTFRHTDIGPEHPLTGTLADLRREPAVDRILLHGLDQDGIVAYLQAAHAGPVDDELDLARALHAHTSGNPFFVGELVRHLGESGATYRRRGTWSYYAEAGGVGVPEGVREVLGRRLNRLSDAAREALRWASVIGAEFSLDALEAVAGGSETEAVLNAVEEAVGAHLVVERGYGRYAFAHALVRETIYAEFTTTRRARRHRDVGVALESLPVDEAQRLPALVHHFAEAATLGEAAKAADYAVAAAHQAFAQSAWEDAVALLERGLDALSADDPHEVQRRCDLLLMLAETWCRYFDGPKLRAAAREAVELARVLQSPERMAQATRWYLTAAPTTLREEGNQLAQEALTLLGNNLPAARALVLARLAALNRDDDTSREALELARRSGDKEALGVALFVRSGALAITERARERLAVAEELVSSAPPDGWDGWRAGHEQRAVARLVTGDRPGFDADVAATARLGADRRFWYYQQKAELWLGTQALLDGRFDEVEACVATAESRASEQRVGPAWSSHILEMSVIQLTKLALERGRPDSAKARLSPVVERMPECVVLRAMLASAHADLGEKDCAHLEAEAVHALLAGQILGLESVSWSYLSEVAATLGDPDLACGIEDRLRPFSGLVVAAGPAAHCPGAVDRYLGQLSATLGRWEDAQALYEGALGIDEGLRSPPLLARTRYWYGRMLVERGARSDTARARDLLAASFETAAGLGMARLATLAAELLDGR